MRIITFSSFIVLFLSTLSMAGDTLFYIRDGATGTYATTQCDTWASDRACDDLPTPLSRGTTGATYYVADGNYGGYIFSATNAAVDGTKIITIKKATASDHGTETGWDSGYGDGQAIFQQPDLFDNIYRKYVYIFGTSYITIDGVTGSGNDDTSYGFKFLQHPSYGDDDNVFPYMSGYEIVGISYNRKLELSNIKLLHMAVMGTGWENCSDADPYECTTDCIRAYSSPSEGGSLSNVEIGYTYTYGCVNNINVSGVTDVSVHHNYLDDNVSHAEGAHGQNMNIDTDTNIDIFDNVLLDSETFVIALHNNNLGVITNAKIYNNIFINGTSITGCISSMGSTTSEVIYSSYVHHNTVHNIDCGGGRGFFHTGNLNDVESHKSYAYNNIFYSSSNVRLDNYERTSGTIVHDYNAYLACTGTNNDGDESNSQVDAEATNPFVDIINGDYSINGESQVSIDHIINKGKTDLGSTYAYDFNGYTRDASPDIGAFESGASDITAPESVIAESDSTVSVNNITLTGTSTDAVGVTSCKWRIGSAPDGSNGTACTGTTSFSCSITGLISGANTVYVGCTDAAANWGSGDNITVTFKAPTAVGCSFSGGGGVVR